MDLPKRKNMRLRDYDYSQVGNYFITICTKDRQHLFGKIVDIQMVLNEYGKIVEKHIQKINILNMGITITKYIIMPNHIHMIVSIRRDRIVCGPCISCVPQNENNPTKSQIPKMIQSFKSAVTKELRDTVCNGTHTMRSLQYQPVWQKSYHDHIIRNEAEYQKIWEYIDTNPFKWKYDCLNM